MSMPNIPPVSPAIEVTAEQAVNILLASIAFEELGLAHLINAEAEKIQFVLGTLPNQTTSEPSTIEDLLAIDECVRGILHDVIKTQMLLQFKLEDVLDISTSSTTTTTTTTTESTTTTTTESTTTTTTESTTTTTTESTTTTTTESTTTTTESTTTTTTESTTTTTTESTTTTTESTTTTTESTTTTSTTTTTTTTTCYTEAGSAWGVGTHYGDQPNNAQYFILPDGQTSITTNLGLGANNTDIGSVTATRNGNNLDVTVTVDNGCVMSEVQVEVNNNAVPTTNIPGQFDYKFTATGPSQYVTTYTFNNINVKNFTNIYIAAHAKIYCPCED